MANWRDIQLGKGPAWSDVRIFTDTLLSKEPPPKLTAHFVIAYCNDQWNEVDEAATGAIPLPDVQNGITIL
jgi:hypothetical protein